MWVCRCGVWVMEIFFVLVSGIVLFWLGQLGNIGNKFVFFNFVVVKIKEVIVNIFGIFL